MEINSLWIGDSLSQMEILSMKSHLKQGHRCHLWCYDSFPNLPIGVIVEDANQILPKSRVFTYQMGFGKGSYSAFSNIFRYKLLLEHGGWWCDTDVVAIQPFDFKEEIVFASERLVRSGSVPTTCVIKLPKGSEVAAYCYEKSCSINQATLEWGEIGPDLLREAILRFGLVSCVKPPNTFCPTDWFEAQKDPLIHREVDLTNSHSVHLWHEMWRQSTIDKNGDYDDTSLYGRLIKDFNDVP